MMDPLTRLSPANIKSRFHAGATWGDMMTELGLEGFEVETEGDAARAVVALLETSEAERGRIVRDAPLELMALLGSVFGDSGLINDALSEFPGGAELFSEAVAIYGADLIEAAATGNLTEH